MSGLDPGVGPGSDLDQTCILQIRVHVSVATTSIIHVYVLFSKLEVEFEIYSSPLIFVTTTAVTTDDNNR